MKHKNMTFSIPEDLRAVLYAHIEKTRLSGFISHAIRKSLEEALANKEKELDTAYEAANQDSDRLETIRDWNGLDPIIEELTDENWDWLKNANTHRKK